MVVVRSSLLEEIAEDFSTRKKDALAIPGTHKDSSFVLMTLLMEREMKKAQGQSHCVSMGSPRSSYILVFCCFVASIEPSQK